MSLPVQSDFVTADKLIVGGKCMYFGYSALETAASTATANIYDGTSSSGKRIGSIGLAASAYMNIGPFTRGVVCEAGIFVDFTSGAADVIIYYTPEVVMDEILVNFAGSQRYIQRYLTAGDVMELFELKGAS